MKRRLKVMSLHTFGDLFDRFQEMLPHKGEGVCDPVRKKNSRYDGLKRIGDDGILIPPLRQFFSTPQSQEFSELHPS